MLEAEQATVPGPAPVPQNVCFALAITYVARLNPQLTLLNNHVLRRAGCNYCPVPIKKIVLFRPRADGCLQSH